jgi:hypothetical protein
MSVERKSTSKNERLLILLRGLKLSHLLVKSIFIFILFYNKNWGLTDA